MKPIRELVAPSGRYSRLRPRTQRWIQILAARDLMRALRAAGVQFEPFDAAKHDWPEPSR